MLEQRILAVFAAISLAVVGGCKDNTNQQANKDSESAASIALVSSIAEDGLSSALQPKTQTSNYDSRFTQFEVSDLKEENISAAQANAFDKRFDVFDIITLIKNGRTASVVNNYAAHFTPLAIMHVLCNKKRCIDPAIVNAYSIHFNEIDILLLQGNKTKDGKDDPVSPQFANAFNNRFSGIDILLFHDFDITPEIANKYTSLTASQIILPKNVLGDISEITNQYDPMLRSSVLVLKAMNLSPKEANAMVAEYKTQQNITPGEEKQRFGEDDVRRLIIAKIAYAEAAAYEQRFTAKDIVEFKPYGIAAKTANSYNKGFTVDDIIDLDSVYSIDPNTANKNVNYYKQFVKENNSKEYSTQKKK
ncbi:hypothetical protein HZA96_06370 [Candidatus Woesearchaeota archaeon]|nr:hypothetical protein [Candidatus Woesearchaeota archaeon]